jgi:hypothetical protein
MRRLIEVVTDRSLRPELVPARVAEIEQRVQSALPDAVRFVVDRSVRAAVRVA